VDDVVPFQDRVVSVDGVELHLIWAHRSVYLSLADGNALRPVHCAKRLQSTASSILEVASMLPYWAKLLVRAPFVFAYIVARMVVLTKSIITLRALPAVIYQDVNWSSFSPHT
jgi:hypothetical protein